MTPRLSPEQQKELGFIPPAKVKFTRLPFGISEAVSCFSELVSQLYSPEGFSPYMDDVGFGDKTVQGAQEKLWAILLIAAKNGLTFGIKLTLFALSIVYLGHLISREGVQLDPERVKGLLELKNPTNIAELRTWLGAVTFCNDFLGGDFCSIAAPLTDLLRDNKRLSFGWKEEIHGKAIEQLKQALTNAPILAIYDNKLETAIISDG